MVVDVRRDEETKEILHRGSRDLRGRIARRWRQWSKHRCTRNRSTDRCRGGCPSLPPRVRVPTNGRRIILAEVVPMVRTWQRDVLRRFVLIEQLNPDDVGNRFGEELPILVGREILLVDPFDLLQVGEANVPIASLSILVSRSGEMSSHQSLSDLSLQDIHLDERIIYRRESAANRWRRETSAIPMSNRRALEAS